MYGVPNVVGGDRGCVYRWVSLSVRRVRRVIPLNSSLSWSVYLALHIPLSTLIPVTWDVLGVLTSRGIRFQGVLRSWF